MRDALHDGIQDVLDTLASLARGTDDIRTVAADKVDDLIFHLIGHGRRHVDLVDHGDNLQIMVDGHIEIRDGLRLHALGGIDHQQRSLAGRNRTRHLVGEVHMSWSIDQIQDILLALIHILHLDGMTLDGDATLSLQIHVVQHLTLRHLNSLGELQQTVCQGGLTMVDMCDNAEIPDMIH